MSETVLAGIFWFSVVSIFWTYIGYYLFLRLISLGGSHTPPSGDFTPMVSIVISAYNEENSITNKLDNCLALDYPRENLEIIVASDGSTDGTDDIVRKYDDKGIKLIRLEKRMGKHFAQERGIRSAKNDIIVLTDATTILERDSVSKIVRSFADPGVGSVSGKDRVRTYASGAHGEGAYVQYEMGLRILESRVSSLVGVSGSFFAVRKEICETWYPDMSSDFFIPIVAYMLGFRSVLDEEAIGCYTIVKDPEREFARKVRTVVHGLEVLFRLRSILNPFKYGFYAFQMLNHKLMRWIVPLFFALALIFNILLVPSSQLYVLMLAFQISFYLTALGAFLVKRLEKHALFKVPFFLVMVNFSIVAAWWKFLIGERYISWERTER
jgi:glycosyltransferase involved in cell wall biosynthesis